MKRRLFKLLAALSRRSVRYSVVIAWVLSTITLLYVQNGGGWSSMRFRHLQGRWSYLTDGSQGRLQLILCHDLASPIMGPVVPMGVSAAYTTFVSRFPGRLFWLRGDFGIESGWEIGTTTAPRRVLAEGSRYWLMVPYWAVAFATGGVAAAIWFALPITVAIRKWRHQRELVASGARCARCNYDLRATPCRCPECGTVPSKVTKATS